MIVIDDPLEPEEALSQAQRQAANEWYDHTLYSRLNDKLGGAIVLIMHHLHGSLPSGTTRRTTSPPCRTSPARLRWLGKALDSRQARRVIIIRLR